MYYLWEQKREKVVFFCQGWWFSSGAACEGKQADLCPSTGFFFKVFYFLNGNILRCHLPSVLYNSSWRKCLNNKEQQDDEERDFLVQKQQLHLIFRLYSGQYLTTPQRSGPLVLEKFCISLSCTPHANISISVWMWNVKNVGLEREETQTKSEKLKLSLYIFSVGM